MPLEIGTIETVTIRDVWPKEDANFTPWLRSHIGELDKLLGLGLTNARSEVGAGDFNIDIVAETNFGDIVIENQFGRSDHRHLGQLVTYLSHREVQRAIWIVEEGRPEHVKAVEVLNERGIGQIWMLTVRAIKIGSSAPAPLFTIVAEPSEIERLDDKARQELTPTQIKRRDFMAALFAQARDEGIDSPFRDLAPSIHGILHTPARGQGLLYRVAVNRTESRVVVTNASGRWQGALAALIEKRPQIDADFGAGDLPKALEWPELVTAGRWAIRYTVEASYLGGSDSPAMRELNQASAEMKRVFEPHLRELAPGLEEESAADESD